MMNCDELIGKVSALYLKKALETDGSDGTARFIVDRLSAKQTAAIAKTILADDALSSQIEICLPAHFMEGQGLPDTTITYERATYHRHAKCDKPALLLATTGDDEAQSLNLLTPIGSSQLAIVPELWIEIAASGLALSSEERKWWEKSLKGLFELNIWSTEQIAEYVIYTRKAYVEDGHPIIHALGSALYTLHIPKDTCFFSGIKAQHRGHASRWRNLYESAYRRRGCYLSKLTPTQTLLNEGALLQAFDKAKPAIADSYHDLIRDFIKAPTGWNDKARSLSECEWEDVGQHLFEGLKKEKKTIGELTFEFYDEREHELLSDEERDYLKRLRKRGKSPHKSEEDEQFYEDHRNELKDDRRLKSLWDRFIFGTARESTDFLKGLLMCFETLFTQKRPSTQARMVIRCDRRSKKDFKDLNVDAGLFFACRYRGLRELFGPKVEWKVDPLFSFAELVEDWRQDRRTKLCTSVAKAALQIKFTIELEVELLTGGIEKYLTQLVWKFNPNCVETEFYHDFKRLAKHALVFCGVTREPLSTKGEFQPLDLTNVRSFGSAYGRDRGSFVSVYKKSNDIAEIWLKNLSEAKRQGLIHESAIGDIENKFNVFKRSYAEAIKGFLAKGVAHEGLLNQLSDFSELIEKLCRDAKGDRNRALLLNPLLKIGAVSVDGEKPVVIAAPWHPLKLSAMAVKSHQVADLLQRFLDAEEITFGDTGRFFFNDLLEALGHPYYPEVILGWQDQKANLLSLTDVVGDYSLYEVPVITGRESDGTNENPNEAANLVADLVNRYLKLLPHEHANLSIVLYNCDSVRLPKAVVEKIRVQHEEDEDVLCQIILRHRSSQRLRNLYETIIEGGEEDVDSFSPSEATRDFMARLRINIMADQAPPPDPRDGFPMDIVFSQDVIARRATIAWYPEKVKVANLFDLIPSQWSRRRPASKDDMKSVVYLCCPSQSREGWSYLTAITTFIKGDWDEKADYRLLPARQLDFQEPEMVSIFQETHNLANWVVNYDELIDRRQLINQGVRVIRYKQSATQGRNTVISSNAPMGMLESMLIRRL
ncbi:DNA translocase FtsK, partial [Thermodesulfobacteriota bacterium]